MSQSEGAPKQTVERRKRTVTFRSKYKLSYGIQHKVINGEKEEKKSTRVRKGLMKNWDVSWEGFIWMGRKGNGPEAENESQ